MEIIRELNKESLLNCYPIYISYRWSMLSIINPTLKSICHSCFTLISVVATTCRNSTSAKLSVGYLVVGITKELDKEPLLHCYPIYISYRWSMLQQCIYLMSTLQWLCKTVHPALTSIYPICGSNMVYMLPDVII